MGFKIEFIDKETKAVLHSITGCRTHQEAIKIAASFRNDNQEIIISEYGNNDEAILYISKGQSEYVLSKTKELIERLEKSKKASKELKEAIKCIEWLRRWFMPTVDLDNN